MRINIEPERYPLGISRHTHRQALTAGVVASACWYRSSSYPAYIGLSRPERWLHQERLLALSGGARSYAAMVDDHANSGDSIANNGWRQYFGCPAFVNIVPEITTLQIPNWPIRDICCVP